MHVLTAVVWKSANSLGCAMLKSHLYTLAFKFFYLYLLSFKAFRADIFVQIVWTKVKKVE